MEIWGDYAQMGKMPVVIITLERVFLLITTSTDIQELVEHIDKDEYLKQLKNESTKSKQNLQKQFRKVG